MGREDRAVARALRRWLCDGETLLASAAGHEADGRRRQVVLLTDRRLLIANLRGAPPTELGLEITSASYDPDGAVLVFDAGQATARVRGIDAGVAAQIRSLLANHRPLPDSASAGRVPHVRIQRARERQRGGESSP